MSIVVLTSLGSDSVVARVEELIVMADALLEAEPGELAPQSEAYLKALQIWLDAFDVSSEKANAAAIKSLQVKHEALLEHCKQAGVSTLQDLKELRQRGKALLSYIDTLPKQISIRRGKQG